MYRAHSRFWLQRSQSRKTDQVCGPSQAHCLEINKWNKRQRGHQELIGRVHTVHPLYGDKFYLKILLHHDNCMVITRSIHLMTINSIIYESYKAVSRAQRLRQDDEERNTVLQEAAPSKLCSQIISLFVGIIQCLQSSSLQQLDNHVEHWWDDLRHKIPADNEDQPMVMVRGDVGNKLLHHCHIAIYIYISEKAHGLIGTRWLHTICFINFFACNRKVRK